MKLGLTLSSTKHRDTYVIREGVDFFYEAFPYTKLDDPSELYKHMSLPQGIPNEIVPGHIWLGNAYHAKDLTVFKGIGFTHVLNITTEIGNVFENKGYTYLKIPIGDYVKSDISVHFKQCFEFLDQNKDKRILVHCVLGRSRSATIMVMYLMKVYHLNYQTASDLLLQMRMSAQINLGFEQQLIDFEESGFTFVQDQ